MTLDGWQSELKELLVVSRETFVLVFFSYSEYFVPTKVKDIPAVIKRIKRTKMVPRIFLRKSFQRMFVMLGDDCTVLIMVNQFEEIIFTYAEKSWVLYQFHCFLEKTVSNPLHQFYGFHQWERVCAINFISE